MLKLINYVYEKLFTIVAISYWIQLYDEHPYSKSFDDWCRKSLDDGCKVISIDRYTVKFNGKTLWIGNGKVACFTLYEKGKPSVSPSRYTKYLMMKQYRDSWRD